MKNFPHKKLDTTYLPKRDDETYSDIENFQDYELKNNLIFELVLRTKEYASLQGMKKYERVTAAKSIGFSDKDAKYVGLPWMLLKLMIQKNHIDKKGQVFDIKMFFNNLICQYKNDDSEVGQIVYSMKAVYDYFSENNDEFINYGDKEYTLKDLLSYYSIEDEYIIKNIIDGYYKIVDYYVNTFDDSIKYREDIEKDFHDFVKFYSENSECSSKDVLSSFIKRTKNITSNVLSEYKRKDKLTLSDIEDGLNKLICYFIDHQKVYTVNGVLVRNITEQMILKHQDKCVVIFVEDSKGIKEYYLLLLSESEKMFGNGEEANKANKVMSDIRSFTFKTYKKISMRSVLDNSLQLLNMNSFLLNLEAKDVNIKHKKISLSIARPKLKLEKDKILNIEIDMSLSEKELLDYIKKLKNDYDDNKEILKSPFDLFDNDTNVNDTLKFKKNMRDSFFCYDYYSVRLKLTLEHNNNETARKINNEIKRIKKSDQYKPKERREQIEKLENQLLEDNLLPSPEPTIRKDSDYFVFKESEFKKSTITSHTAQKYYSQIYNYIKKLGYEKNIDN